MPPHEYSHGILGHWAVVGHGFNIASIASSGVVIVAFVCACIQTPRLYWRPSFRISATVAACDAIYSASQLCVFNNAYMSSLSEMNLRVIHWLMSASILSFAFLCSCVGIHLLLVVLTKNKSIADRIHPWYEVASILLGFLITHPFLYLYEHVEWAPDAQVFHIYDDPSYYRLSSWLTMWAWLFAACFFLMVVGILTFLKMLCVFKGYLTLQSSPDGDVCDNGLNKDARMNCPHNIRQREQNLFSVTMRILIYSLVPIATQLWVLVANMLINCPMWLYVMANIIPATQGMINLIIFFSLPAWDNYRRTLAAHCSRIYANNFNNTKGDELQPFAIEEGSLCPSINSQKHA
ncbi:hypothetical protein COEREDRAFT_94186 [Coemansia reversa NRRL 1564]|uniref:G-protein coupled receptors family 1 profile domain-containing protein n=1 Tax=Coemansia reversa (strain ATCC 12441 / NRRL 1564) TaxID=763665 RepID=A0A2G5B4N1_COERN|nr:hypothetical protein COEREDRAFT_94186 [Coemansia reversa NRRL 1564]|eukprot:PIA13978.1 hypothetical protein COEREDRAFT_94186 [Coemansia reversa NRRL 1564]